MKEITKTIKPYYFPIFVALVSKIYILFFVGILAKILTPSLREGLDLWRVWDVPNYLSLAEFGYQTIGLAANFLVLLPAFPLFISIAKFIFFTDFLIAGFIVSSITSVLLAVMFYKVILLDYSKKIASIAIIMLFVFPTSFFLHIPYSESFFILSVVSAFYYARKRNYILSFVFVGLATFTKIAGLALIPALFLEIFLFDKQFFIKKNILGKVSFILFGLIISLSGFLFYLLLNYFIWGNFFHFTAVQQGNYQESFSPFGKGLLDSIQSISWRIGWEKIFLGYGQVIAFILGLIASVYAIFKIRLSYGVYSILVLFFAYAMSFWICMPRYILPIFPIYIVLALISENKILGYLLTLISVSLLILMSIVFVHYGPVL